jgi:hypothetical protein
VSVCLLALNPILELAFSLAVRYVSFSLFRLLYSRSVRLFLDLAGCFSGGLDCVVLARLADLFLPIEEPIDLINVAFGGLFSFFPDLPPSL